jgi:hypothetical protein
MHYIIISRRDLSAHLHVTRNIQYINIGVLRNGGTAAVELRSK